MLHAGRRQQSKPRYPPLRSSAAAGCYTNLEQEGKSMPGVLGAGAVVADHKGRLGEPLGSVTSGFGQLLRLVCFCPATTTVSAKSSPTRDTSMQHARDREGNDNWASSPAGRRQEKDTDGMNIAEKREGLAEGGASTKQPVDRACLPCRLSHLACDSYPPSPSHCWLINSAPMLAMRQP